MASNVPEPEIIDLSSDNEDDNPQDEDDNPQGGIYRLWLFCDELLILNTLAAELRNSGKKMSNTDLFDAVHRDLHREDTTAGELSKKVSALKTKFMKALNGSGPNNSDRDQRLFELSKEVWPEELRN